MAQSFFFDAAVTDGTPDLTYSAADLAMEKSAYFSDGVLSPDGLKASVFSSFLIQMSKGSAVIGGYTYVNTSSSIAQVLTADSTYDRIDLVVLCLDINGRHMYTRVLKGTPAADPQPPAVTYTDGVKELALAQIYVRCGAANLTDEDITDVRKLAEFSPARKTTEEVIGEYLADHGAFQRVELVRYTYGGTYNFETALYPSEGNIYDLVLVGGGGAGGCVISEYGRGGGGGCCSSASSKYYGGYGGAGCVIVYGYRKANG